MLHAKLRNTRVTLYTADHLHTVVPHCWHSRAPIVHTAVPRENNQHGCVYLRCKAVCKLPGSVEGHPWNSWTQNADFGRTRGFGFKAKFWRCFLNSNSLQWVTNEVLHKQIIKMCHCWRATLYAHLPPPMSNRYPIIIYRKISNLRLTESQNLMFIVSDYSCLYAIYSSQVLSGEGRYSWSSADRRCSNYIWVIN